MVKSLAAVVATLAMAACGYNASFRDCSIRCTPESGCPSGFTRGPEGLCRSSGASGACSAVPEDGPAADAAKGSDGSVFLDAPGVVVMAENEGSTVTGPASGCDPVNCNAIVSPPGSPVQVHWYREFALQDPPHWDLGSNRFQITSVHLGCSQSSNPHVVVNVYSYAATVLYQGTIDTTQLTLIGSAGSGSTVTIPSCPSDDIAVPISVAPVAAGGAFVVEVFETDYVNGNGNGLCVSNGKFRLGANGAGQFHPSYSYEPDTCQTGSFRTTPTMLPDTQSLVLSVVGIPSS